MADVEIRSVYLGVTGGHVRGSTIAVFIRLCRTTARSWRRTCRT